jgi:hypothetical protein
VTATVEATFHRLFDGIQLTADQESSAGALITRTQQEMQALMPPPFAWFSLNRDSGFVYTLNRDSGVVRMNWDPGRVRMPAESASALIALVSNDADRAKLQSRIVTISPRPPQSEPLIADLVRRDH